MRLLAKAEGDYLLQLKEKTNAHTGGQILIAKKYIDGLETITKNPMYPILL